MSSALFAWVHRPVNDQLVLPVQTLRALPCASALLMSAVVATQAHAAKLASVGVVDKDYLVVNVLDGQVVHNEGVSESVVRYTPELDTSAATQVANWTIRSSDDTSYGSSGLHPVACYRKKKLNGHAQMEWSGSDYRYEYTYQHWIYLRLPSSMQQGMSYTLQIASATNSDVGSV